MVYETAGTGTAGAIRATIDMIRVLDTVAEYSDAAAFAGRCKRVNGALE